MARLSRFWAVAVLLGGATVSLSACTGDPAPTATPSPSPTVVVSETPSPSPSPTVLSDDELLALIPEEARAENFGGATNFARFFVALYAPLFELGADWRLFDALSQDGCIFCDGALRSAAETAEAGAHSTGGHFEFPDASARGGVRSDGFMYVAQRFSVTDTLTYGADGGLIETSIGGAGDVGLKLHFEDGHWQVYEVEFDYDDE